MSLRLTFLLALAFLAACAPKPPASSSTQPAAPANDPNRPPTVLGSETGAAATIYKLVLPTGTCSGNDQVWRQLDEDALDSATTVQLARNGLRAAVAPNTRWPAIAKLLDVPGATSQQHQCKTDGRTALTIATRQSIPEQTIFYFDKDITQYGRTFDRCDNALRLAMSRQRGGRETFIQIEPVVQTGMIEVTRGPMEMGVVRTALPQEETFPQLRLAAKIAPDHFLLLAPANPTKDAFSVGTRFLSQTEQLPATEIVFVLVPAGG